MIESRRLDRREAIKWMLAASATVSLLNFRSFGAAGSGPATGYGLDPDLLKDYKAGDLWPLTFSREQREIAAALCDAILPADDKSPSAGAVGVPDFIDEWISAPYPEQQSDRKEVLDGLAWIDRESQKRFARGFAGLTADLQRRICDDICYEPRAKPEFATAARFFAKFRNLAAGGFYTTPQGWNDIRYVGNVPLMEFKGPPPEVLAYLKLGQV